MAATKYMEGIWSISLGDALIEPPLVKPLSVAFPAPTNQERRLVVHEPAITEDHVTVEI